MSKKTKKMELKVVFDTNVLYTQVASDLLRKEVSELIEKTIEDSNFSISWHLPEIVLQERSFQMLAKAVEQLPSLNKIERVIGHNLGITQEILKERVEAAIQKQCKSHKLQTLTINYSEVDWSRIVKSAVERLPPFEAGQKEKGFRDALAVEAFLQEVAKSPKTPSLCRLAFVSEDSLVRQALQSLTSENANV